MKTKNLIFILFSVALLTFSACTKTEYITEYVESENPNQSYIATLVASNWIRVSPALIEYDIPLKALTDYYLLQGGVAVAISFDDEMSYEVLPATFDGLAYSVRYEKGFVIIAIDDPLSDDGVDVTAPTGNIKAKIILTKTNYNASSAMFNSPSTEFKSLD